MKPYQSPKCMNLRCVVCGPWYIRVLYKLFGYCPKGVIKVADDFWDPPTPERLKWLEECAEQSKAAEDRGKKK